MKTCILAAICMTCSVVFAREWKSADGQKSFPADFVAVQGDKLMLNAAGKPAVFPLTAFSADDQAFAKNAQYIADAATKFGPQHLEFTHPVEDGSGWICRLALQTDPKAPKLFTGETIFLVTADATKHQRGERLENQRLFGAGGRTYHPLQGGSTMVRAFSLDVSHATQVWSDVMAASGGDPAKQVPNILEPDIEIVTKRGIGIVLDKNGLIAIDPVLGTGFKTLVVHHDGKDVPATIFVPKDKAGTEIVGLGKLGIQLMTCSVPVEPARLAPKRPAAVGQRLTAHSFVLNSTKKDLVQKPIVTGGIVSLFGSGEYTFQHDARLTPDSPGGFLIGEKGDVIGFFFQPVVSGRPVPSTTKSRASPAVDELGTAVSTQALSAFMEKIPGRFGLKSGSSGSDVTELGESLRSSLVLVVATFETAKPRQLAAAKVPAAPGAVVPTGWSLSKSGLRHNAKCRYFDPAKSCQQTDGNPCKVCGG